jgi:hypothetical protein
MVIVRIFFMENNTEEPKFILVSIGHNIEHLIFIIVNNLLDGLD